jgi:Transposase domain (DUF772)
VDSHREEVERAGWVGTPVRNRCLLPIGRSEDQVRENYLLRLIDKHIDFGFVRQRVEDSYSDTGPASIDPELQLRILLTGYLYGISSERRLVEELDIAWRWFTGLSFDEKVPRIATGAFRNRSCLAGCSREMRPLGSICFNEGPINGQFSPRTSPTAIH